MTSDPKAKANFTKKTANTVFFRYFPADISITRKNFESLFSDIGPVKKCSLIRQGKDKSESNKREAKGYGFCKFTTEEDAQEAASSLNERTMEMGYGQKVKVWVELAGSGASKKENEKEQVKAKKAQVKAQAEPQTEESTKSKPPTLPEGTPGADTPAETSDDILALQAKKRTSRVIVRNLSFYASEHNIRQVMEEKFGEVVEINLPVVPVQSQDDAKGKKRSQQHRGFAFVTFAKQSSAQKAVDACAGDEKVEVKKRAVAIDFSVSKFQHKRMKEEEEAKDEESKNSTDSESSDSDSSGSGSDSESDDDDDDDDDKSEASDADLGSEKDSDEEMEEEKEKQIPEDSHQHSLFLRNLPFDATRHDLFTLFSQYGHIAGIYLVRDRDTGIGKGTAFVKFSKEGGCMRALEAGGDSDAFKSGKNISGENNAAGGGIFLNGRKIFADLAVDKGTADTLKVERDEEGKPVEKKIGKDRRNLYLKGEGRVENNEGTDTRDPNSFENLPESDQQKRGRAHQEKSTKLRSPLFFINPYRLSVRNLAKHIDENEFKQLVVKGVINGLKRGLVTKDDMIAHWRSSGEMDTRAIIEKITSSDKSGGLVTPFDEKRIKKYIPSVFIDRDFDATMKSGEKGKGERLIAPSRGFAFVEFTEHAHAMACLRELNNNMDYSGEFVSGGKRALQMKNQRSKKSKKGKVNPNANLDDGPSGSDFVGDDGKVRIPRLLVEFTAENKAKARKQAENKTQQLENAQKQKVAAKAAIAEEKPKNKNKKKVAGRGAQQRAKKRKMIEEGVLDKDGNRIEDAESQRLKRSETVSKETTAPQEKKQKEVKPTKKPRKVDKEENNFEDMVQSYKNTFAGIPAPEKAKEAEPSNPRVAVSEKRWFE